MSLKVGGGTGQSVGPITLDVTQYGADPTGVADATAAINAAILALPVTGGIVYIPTGDYKINGTINIGDGSAAGLSTRAGVILTGAYPAGPYISQGGNLNPLGFLRGTTRLFSGAAATMIKVNGPLMSWGIRNLTLDGLNLGLAGIDEIACQGGASYDCTIQSFTLFGQRCRPLNNTGALSGAGPNHALNTYKNWVIAVPNINNAVAISITDNGVAQTTDTWGNSWDHLTIKFIGPPSGTNTVYGLYLRAADNLRFHDLFFETPGPCTGSALYYAVVYDYTSVWPNLPGDCRIDLVDFQFSGQTSGINPVANIGSPPAYALAFPNSIQNISLGNVTPPNPNLPNLVWEGTRPPLTKSVAGGANVTLTAAETLAEIMQFTGTLTGSINVIVSNAAGKQYTVFNNTAGAFTLTVIGASGTGIAVGQGKRARLYGDGTNIVRAAADV